MPMGKLVRDNIPDLIRASGRTPDVRVLDDTTYREALHDKLLEEAAELKEAVTTTEVVAEIADVLEVIAAMAALHGLTFEDLVVAAERKRCERGGFVQRWWLSATGADCLPDGHGAAPDVGELFHPTPNVHAMNTLATRACTALRCGAGPVVAALFVALLAGSTGWAVTIAILAALVSPASSWRRGSRNSELSTRGAAKRSGTVPTGSTVGRCAVTAAASTAPRDAPRRRQSRPG